MSPSRAVRPGHYLGSSATTSPVSIIKWRLLIKVNGDAYLHELILLSSDRGPDVAVKLVRKYKSSQSWFSKAVPFLVPVVYRASLSPVPLYPAFFTFVVD